MNDKKPDEITLRDYFAAKAMQALATDLYATKAGCVFGSDDIARWAYVTADAMLNVREITMPKHPREFNFNVGDKLTHKTEDWGEAIITNIDGGQITIRTHFGREITYMSHFLSEKWNKINQEPPTGE
ncbi:hypothetical protein [Xenorhabdus sp. KK7.4]|uniref:hypothetical protein n=2 Tax=Xenorhabdus TaxID=626 RepID=UPI000C066A42|nr:hypothetical protein [Xenorhabdus sp. KK7.4]PHM50147.1 hypothetical protein Xekk_04225 [Xenorhabdus sp. KK7.4]